MTDKEFLSCDWGTSNFRIRLISVPELTIPAEETSDEGVAKTFKAWQEKNDKDDKNKMRFYTDVLQQHIIKIESAIKRKLDGVQVVISGMASSSIGFTNLPYQHLPFGTDGSGLKTRSFEPTAGFNHAIILVSGVQSDDDVMRGEETQLVGCMTDEMLKYKGEQLLIHPGTHSKHMQVKNKQVVGFSTYMTGEFFKLLSTESILHENVNINRDFEKYKQAFVKGVHDAADINLLHAAFKVRTNDLFNKLPKPDNYFYLSGLLIGYELSRLNKEQSKIYLCSGASLSEQYTVAIGALNLKDKVTVLPPRWVDESVIRGQYKILEQLKK